MDILLIPEQKHTPRILLDPASGIFEIEGISLPEDIFAFYEPVLSWLDAYIAYIRKFENQHTYPAPEVTFKLNYYNSGSVRMITSVLQKLRMITDLQPGTLIEWYYEEEDLHILENGKDLAELTGLTFQFKLLKD